MRIHIANHDPQRIGGGFRFSNNFAKGLGDKLSSYEESDIYFIPSASTVTHQAVEKAHEDGKKIVLRVDNIIRNSRNRNTGMSRMMAFAEVADLIVFQSEYARQVLGMQYLNKAGVVILNGCDTEIFNPNGRSEDRTTRFLYSRYNRDETKNWEMARFTFQQECLIRDGKAKLNIVGQFSPELMEYNFDFYMGEDYHYWGVISDTDTMAQVYKNTDILIYSYWNDACSNTLIEALCSGCGITDHYGMLSTGGAPDIMDKFHKYGADYFSLHRMTQEYLDEIAKL